MWLFLLITVKFVFLSFAASSGIEQSTIEFCRSRYDSTPLCSGYIVSESTVVLSESCYNKSGEIRTFEYFDGRYRGPSFNSGPFPLSTGSFKKLNDLTYIFESDQPVFQTNRVMRINRYPIYKTVKYGNITNYATLPATSTALSRLPFEMSNDIVLLSNDKCEELFSNFNSKSQMCAENEHNADSPLVATIDSKDYLIGLADTESSENGTIFNLINDKYYNVPTYSKCDYTSDIPSQFAICNSMEISEDLKESGHPETILIGNVEVGDSSTFLPLGFGTVVSNDQILVSSDIMRSLENYEIYGNGKVLKVAIMLDNIVIQDYDYLPTDINITYGNEKHLQLLKFGYPVFNNVPKAKFNFEESFKSFNEKRTNNKIKSLQFVNDKLIIRKFVKDENEFGNEKDSEISSLIPLFYNNHIIGFKEENLYISAFDLQEFLGQHVVNLQRETTSTTPKTTTTATTTNVTTTKIPTTTPVGNGKNLNETSTRDGNSSANKLVLTLWPLILAVFQFSSLR